MKKLKKLEVKLVEGEYDNPLKGKVNHPEQLYEVFMKIKDYAQETMIGVFLDGNHEVRAYDVLSLGNGSETILDPVSVFEHAILVRSKRFILLHNHPSGNPKPSPDDLIAIKDLIVKAEVMNYVLVDFIIIGDLQKPRKKNYWSLFEHQNDNAAEYAVGSVW